MVESDLIIESHTQNFLLYDFGFFLTFVNAAAGNGGDFLEHFLEFYYYFLGTPTNNLSP